MPDRFGQTAVIFPSHRNAADLVGYDVAAITDTIAGIPLGFRGVDAARGANGDGIAISWSTDEATAIASLARSAHAAIRDRGHTDCSDAYEVTVATTTRHYGCAST